MPSAAFMRIISPCWKPFADGERSGDGGGGRVEGLLWYKDLGHHASGEFSMAATQANDLMEDGSRLESGPMSSLESGPQGTFVGVFDGHGGPEASHFVSDHLFNNLKRITSENHGISTDVIIKSFLATEDDFISYVRKQWRNKPQIASVGTCCLVGVVCGGVLYIANAGDSRVVLGKMERNLRDVKAIQMSTEHNACFESVREEMRLLHPDDPQIVVLKHKVWRVKGLIQVSRSIGDAYLKFPEFNREPLLPKFRLPQTFHNPILRAEPSVYAKKLYPEDKFLIFASDGLWEHLSNQEAADIIHSCPRNGVARRLVKAALHIAARKREMRYADLKKIERGIRRHFHDDITVVVLFLDTSLIGGGDSRRPLVSVSRRPPPLHISSFQ